MLLPMACPYKEPGHQHPWNCPRSAGLFQLKHPHVFMMNENKFFTWGIYHMEKLWVCPCMMNHINHALNDLITAGIWLYINSLWLRDDIWQHKSESTSAQVMAWCLMATSHHLNHGWHLINKVLWHSPENNFTLSAQGTTLYYEFGIYASTYPMGQWVNLRSAVLSCKTMLAIMVHVYEMLYKAINGQKH